jgi:NAD(P)-dependent dehydrogenase (short-subunit alcohol dehydrogenase family)
MAADFSLQGHVALVTGGSSGLGRAMAQALADAGAKVVLVARRQAELEHAVDALCAGAGVADYVVADLADRTALETVARQATQPFGAPDILVNAAGVNLRQPIEQVDMAAWDLHIQLHLTAPFFLAQALVPAMREKRWGRIINIASLQSVRAFPDSAPYGAGKGGIMQLTRAMAEAWSRDGITVNAIAPGFFPTELTAAVFNDPEKAQANARQTMIGRNGVMQDIHGPVQFLASDAAAYITGQTLFVDGGFSAK